jgi:hypothetical protein
VQNAFYAVGIGTAGGGGGGCNTPTSLAASSITSTSATVSWATATGAVSYNLQYKVSTVSTWTTVSGITSTSYGLTGLTASTIYNYQVQSVCSGGTSTYSTAASFTTLPSGGITYCTTKGSTGYEYINKVAIGTINNTSGNNSGYGNYTALNTSLAAGSSASITLTPGFTSSSYREYWTVYIDYNKDGDFTDANEQATSGNAIGALTKSFTVPSTAKSGATRMRIIMHYGSSRTSTCGTFSDGEAEDYTVNITGGTFTAIAAAGNTSVNTLAVSPNPVKASSANIILQLIKAGAVNIKIADLSGRILRTETINSTVAGSKNYRLNNLSLFPGTYMIVAEQNSTIIARSQFIVEK